MLRISVVEGGPNKRVQRYTRNLMNLKPGWEAVYDELRRMYTEQFDTEGRYRSHGWQEITGKWMDEKARRGYPYPTRIGHATGDMRRAYTTKGAKGNRSHVDPDGVTIATSIPYTHFFNEVRPLMRFTREDRRTFRTILARYITEF